MRQRQRSLLARASGMVLGHLPAAVQNRLADELVIRERMDREPFRVLPKPFDIGELVASVRACISAQSN